MKKSFLFSMLCMVVIAFTSCSNEILSDVPENSEPELKTSSIDWDINVIRVDENGNIPDGYINAEYGDVWLDYYSQVYYDYCPVVEFSKYGVTRKYWSLAGDGGFNNFTISCNSNSNIINDEWGIIINIYRPNYIGGKTNLINFHDNYNDYNIIGSLHLLENTFDIYGEPHNAFITLPGATYIEEGSNFIFLVLDRETHTLYMAGGTKISDFRTEDYLAYIKGIGGFKNYMEPLLDLSPFYRDGEYLLGISLGGHSHLLHTSAEHTYIGEIELFDLDLVK